MAKKTDKKTAKPKLGIKRDTLKKLSNVDKKDLGQVAGGLYIGGGLYYGGGLSRNNCG